MNSWIAALLFLPILLQQPDPEARIIEYLTANLEPAETSALS